MKTLFSIKDLLILFLLFLFAVVSQSQSTINGKIIDASSSKGLAHATLLITGTSFRVTTKEDGSFRVFIPEKAKGFRLIADERQQDYTLVRTDSLVLKVPTRTLKKAIHPFTQKTLKGLIVDNNGQAVTNANIRVEGTDFKVNTDQNGHFSLYLPPLGKGLLVSWNKKKYRFALPKADFQLLQLTEKKLKKAPSEIDSIWIQQTTAQKELTQKDFNRGFLYHPLQLIQGKVAGLGIARPGDNPNEDYILQLRGLTSFSNRTQALIVVDGMPEVVLQDLDPKDIAAIKVLKDATASAPYSIRGSGGVIEIKTKKATTLGWRINYQFDTSLDKVTQFWSLTNPKSFVDLEGVDMGGATDWQRRVSQDGISYGHYLNITKGGKRTNWRLALNYRDVNGTLKKTGFDQYNARLHWCQNIFNEKLQLTGNFAINRRMADLGFNEAYRYAITYNPTAPIYDDSMAAEAFGGYFTILAFDFFNPLAILEQNSHRAEQQLWTGNIKGQLELLKGLHLHSQIARQQQIYNQTAFYAPTSFFRGFLDDGRADQFRLERSNDFWHTFIQAQLAIDSIRFDLKVGYRYQQISRESYDFRAINFAPRPFSFQAIETYSDVELVDEFSHYDKDIHELADWYGNLKVSYKKLAFLNITLCRAGSSRLGINNKWAWFPTLSAGFNFGKWVNLSFFDFGKMRLGYGKTGNVPDAPYLSQRIYTPQGTSFQNGSFQPAYFVGRSRNFDLKWEEKSEWNVGLDLALWQQKLKASLDVFVAKSTDLIQTYSVPLPPYFSNIFWDNTGGIRNKGWELSIQALPIQKKDLNLSLYWNLAHVQSTLTAFQQNVNPLTNTFPNAENPITFNFLGAPGGNLSPHQIQIGALIGQIIGARIQNNNPISFQDLDRDGNIEIGDGGDDISVIANGLPSYSSMFSSKLSIGNFEFSFGLRGVFGHQLVNINRIKYEIAPDVHFNSHQNYIRTDKFINADNNFNWLSDYVAENASFVRLQYLTLVYNWPLATNNFFKSIRLSLTGQNLFTWTAYAGVDPEVRYFDWGSGDNGGMATVNFLGGFLAPGLDRRTTYLPSKVGVFSVVVTF